ncbi:MAG: serine hydrolase domain-containing protein [candidate division NC10 bacterium]
MTSLKIRLSASWLLLALVLHPALLAQGLSRSDPQEVGLSARRLQRLSDALQGYVDSGQLAGAVALVARRGKVAYLESFGQRDRESNAPMKEGTIFRIASQTKAVVSVGVMILQEQGRLLITDPVGKYLPEFLKTNVAVPREGEKYDIVEARRPITIRDLLTHTSGISYGTGVARDRWAEAGIQGWYFANRDEPVGATVARIAALPFDAQPGERWIYGYSIDVLGALIERVSGLPLDDFLTTQILDPLDMRDTHFYLPPAKSGRLAVVYSPKEGGGLERAPDPGHMVGQGAYLEGPRKSFSGGAGLLSTAGDYARFLQMLLNEGELDGTRVLTPKTVQLMTVNHLAQLAFRDGLGFGLGFQVVQDVGARGLPGSVGEYGWGGAYHSRYWVDPKEQLVVVYLTQLIPANDLDDQGKVRTLVYQALVD